MRGHAGAADCAIAVGARVNGGWLGSALYPAHRSAPDPEANRVRFCIFSITKTLSATCALRLQEQGQLDIDRPISSWISELQLPSALTLAHVLRHTGG